MKASKTKSMKRIAVLSVATLMSASTVLGMTACQIKVDDPEGYTYRTTTATMPSNWNELTYQDNNDTQIMNYIGSSFFDYDYLFDDELGGKYKEDGSINADAIVSGGYTTNYSAATALKDVTKTVDEKWGYTEEQKKEGGYAWQITLREDLKWDDGKAIKADDFVYSMKEQLNPDFLNYRANTYYDTLRIKNSRGYFYKNTEYLYNTIGSYGYENNAAAVAAGKTIYIDVYDFYNAQGYVTKNGDPITQWLAFDDETVYDTPDAWKAGKAEDPFSAKELWDTFFTPKTDESEGGQYAGYVEVGGSYESWLSIREENTTKDTVWEDVGMYKVNDYSFVICLDKAYSFLKEDGSLSYLAAYYMSSLPLVKQDLYESCKKAPAEGSELWTSNYNSSLATTASWGPYKLVEFQSGKSYKLVKNENWYGYSMDQYAGQYQVTAIACECVPEPNTQWLKFLAGETDDVSLDAEHIADYMNSKYTTYTPGTGTFGMQLFGDLKVLKASSNNNGILAIDEFRQAMSLALNRTNVVETIWPGTAVECFGVVNDQYYYDVENGGVYRNTVQAKKGLLRAYGFTEGEDGKWSNGAEITNATMEEAYKALTGYNPTLAKELIKKAYEKLTANAEEYGYDASKNITIVYGSSVDNAKQRARADYLQNLLNDLTKDTALDGKIKIKFDASAGDKWSDAFKNGDTQIGFGYGFSGNPFNPFDIIGSFVDPEDNLNYHNYWDTSKVQMTLTMPAGDYQGAGKTITMSLVNWFYCLNGLATEKGATYTYNWDAGFAPADVRLEILAALEEQVLTKCYSVMLIGEYSGGLLSPKFTQISYEYNTFMGFGGIRYMIVNMNNLEWAKFVKSNRNDLTKEYKKAA